MDRSNSEPRRRSIREVKRLLADLPDDEFLIEWHLLCDWNRAGSWSDIKRRTTRMERQRAKRDLLAPE